MYQHEIGILDCKWISHKSTEFSVQYGGHV